MMRQLYYCGNNMNQIARKAHALNVIDVQKNEGAVLLFHKAIAEINCAIIELER